MFRFMRRASPEMQLIYTILLTLFIVTFLAISVFAWLVLTDPYVGPVGSCPDYPYCSDQ
jgi:hypothetical protein